MPKVPPKPSRTLLRILAAVGMASAVPAIAAGATPDPATGAVGTVCVNALTDDARTEAAHDCGDGVVTLREAVDYAQSHPDWRDADGRCTVTFASALFEEVRAGRIAWTMRQIDVTGFTNGTLVIRGPSDGLSSLTFDGQDKYRLFSVATGNRVNFENLQFERALASPVGAAYARTYAGGAIFNAGTLTLSNCAFRACRAGADLQIGRAEGGAVCNDAAATSTVLRCTFEQCTAACGGAFANRADGWATFVHVTFRGNAATSDASASAVNGGAVCTAPDAAHTAFINCTLAENRADVAGGAIYDGGRSAGTGLYLLNVIALGNTACGAADDCRIAGCAKVRTSWLGQCNDASDDTRWAIDRSATRLGALPADVFATCGTDGVPAATNRAVGGVTQTYYVRAAEAPHVGSYVKHYHRTGFPDGQYVWYGTTAAAGDAALWSGAGLQTKRLATRWTEDLLGLDASNVSYAGSTCLTEVTGRCVPSGTNDALCVTNGTYAALRDVLLYAAQHVPNYAGKDVTVTFSENFTIAVPEETALDNFTNGVSLYLKGPVTLVRDTTAAEDAYRFFRVNPGNVLKVESVRFKNGYHPEHGGAIHVESGTLWASNCTFASCTADNCCEDWDEPGAYPSLNQGLGFGHGGAVSLYQAENGVLPEAAFLACAFDGCAAKSGNDPELAAKGSCVYQPAASCSSFLDCTFDGGSKKPAANEIVECPHACLVRADATRLYLGSLAEAVDQAVSGDTVERLCADAYTGLTLPSGVTFTDATGDDAFLAYAATALSAQIAGKSHLSLVQTATSVATALNDEATPTVSADDAVDLTSDDAEVAVTPSNVKAGLWYGLGRSDTPAGPYVVREWIRATEDGTLAEPLFAPKSGSSGFYRVRVSTEPIP